MGHLFSMNFDDFSPILGYFNVKNIALWVHQIDVLNIDWAFRCHSTRNVWSNYDQNARRIALWVSALRKTKSVFYPGHYFHC